MLCEDPADVPDMESDERGTERRRLILVAVDDQPSTSVHVEKVTDG